MSYSIHYCFSDLFLVCHFFRISQTARIPAMNPFLYINCVLSIGASFPTSCMRWVRSAFNSSIYLISSVKSHRPDASPYDVKDCCAKYLTLPFQSLSPCTLDAGLDTKGVS